MDLLGDYSSDDDDSRSRSPPTPISQKATAAVGLRIPPVMPPPQQNTKKPAANRPTKTNRRGKKILSLHSVLPPHILEQLTKSEATGMNDDSSDDDNDYEERSKKNSQAKKPASTHQDKGIASFLSALSSAKTTNKATKGSDTGYNKGNIKSGSTPQPAPSSSLGTAFMSVTSTTTIRKKKDGTAPSISTAAVAESPTGSDARQTPTGQGEPVSSLSPSHYQPLSLSPSTAFRPFRTNAGAQVSAAPPVPTVAFGAATHTTISMRRPTTNAAPRYVQRSQQQQHHGQSTSMAPPPAQVPRPAAAHAAYEPAPPPQPTAAASGGGGNSRKKKRQLHKALLAGQLDQAMGSANANQVTQMEQAHPMDYIPQEETYATPANGVKVVSTSMYNPKAGGDVQADLSSQRALGKNQINQLMSAAATFQLQQARNGPNAKANSQRAGAKRKYGW